MHNDESPFEKPEMDYFRDPGWGGVALAAFAVMLLLGLTTLAAVL